MVECLLKVVIMALCNIQKDGANGENKTGAAEVTPGYRFRVWKSQVVRICVVTGMAA